MADYAVTFLSIAVLAGAMLLVWRGTAGRPRSASGAIARVVVAVSVGLLVVAFGTYHLSRSRSFQSAGQLVRRVETSQKVVALTFDDGPTPGYTDEVLEVLHAHDASATFYLTGGECDEHPELLQRIVDAGHELGNHTYTHKRLYFVSGGTVAAEIERTDAVFRAAGYGGPITFRPPGCKRLFTTPLYLSAHERVTVTWNLEPDSIAGLADDPDALVGYVVDGVRPGSIVLLHVMYESREATREALPRILEQLQARGYRFVTVSELLALR